MTWSSRGFTLIEVLVALTLLGVIATLLASGTRLSLDISSRGASKADTLRMEKIERDLLRHQLQGALPYQYWTQTDARRVEHIAFQGESDRIRFISRDGILEGPAVLPRWVEFHRQDIPGDAGKLVVEERRILSPDNQPGDVTSARAETMTCVDLRFGYLDKTGEKPQWSSHWDGADPKAPLPSAVRVQCKTRKDFLELLVPLDYAEAARLGVRFQ
jgi:prepilin-type N-terminal cleavage/methylation domain-containing protein